MDDKLYKGQTALKVTVRFLLDITGGSVLLKYIKPVSGIQSEFTATIVVVSEKHPGYGSNTNYYDYNKNIKVEPPIK